jgi:hypothetical protein
MEYYMKLMKFLILTMTLGLAFACKKDLSPEESLRRYIDYSVSDKSTRDGFIERSTGSMKERLEAMEDQEFEEFAKEMSHVQKKRVRFNHTSCQDDKCFITYTLSYDGKSEGVSVYGIEVRKIAELVQADESWLLANISNVKSYYEAASEITDEDFKKQNQGLGPEEVDQISQ